MNLNKPRPRLQVVGGNRSAEQALGGRVVHDARGTAVWDWEVATAVLAKAKSTELLDMLNNPKLELEVEPSASAHGGDPYNRG